MASAQSTLRVAINTANRASGRLLDDGTLAGPAAELAEALAARLDATLTFLQYDSAGAILAADEKDTWDVAFIASDPARSAQYFFTKPYLAFDATCAVIVSSSLNANEELNRPQVRIASVDGSGYGLQLRRCFGQAEIIACHDEQACLGLLLSGDVEAAAGTRPMLDQAADRNPLLRVLADRYAVLGQAIATPRRRTSMIAALTEFQEQFQT